MTFVNRLLSACLLATPLALAACEAAPPTPGSPTYVDDVYPIVRGNCAHCHGPTYKDTGFGFRFDFYDDGACSGFVKDSSAAGADPAPALAFEKNALPWSTVPNYIAKSYVGPLPMPPPPAERLSDRQIATFKNWAGSDSPPRGSRNNNHNPYYALGDLHVDNGKLQVTIDVSDADGDQVVGELILGQGTPKLDSNLKVIAGAGRTQVTFDLGGLSGEQTLRVQLCDGQDFVDTTAGSVTP